MLPLQVKRSLPWIFTSETIFTMAWFNLLSKDRLTGLGSPVAPKNIFSQVWGVSQVSDLWAYVVNTPDL